MVKDDFIGLVFENKLGQRYIVEEFISSDSKNRFYEVEFLNTGYRKITTKSAIKKGAIKDQYEPSVAGIGYKGDCTIPVKSKEYSVWHNMINRCYNCNSTEYCRYGEKGVTVDSEWYNFAKFCEDLPFIEGWDEELFREGQLYLDKDRKSDPDNKIYSLETCIFLSATENNPANNYNIYNHK